MPKKDLFSDFTDVEPTLDPLATPASNVPNIEPPSKPVTNVFPSITTDYRIAIIGEAPGKDEETVGEPFVGMSGQYLDMRLSSLNIIRNACFIGNVCQIKPPDNGAIKNDISKFKLDGPEIQEGIATLRADLVKYNPNVVILLGVTALWAFKGHRGIDDWRGSFFESDFIPGKKTKCIATFHPSRCLRTYELTPLFIMDFRKALEEGKTDKPFIPPVRILECDWTDLGAIITRLERVLETKSPVSCDIEGGIKNVSCISFATSATYSFIVPFTDLSGNSLWSIDEETILWDLVSQILVHSDIPKTWQNGLYDRFVLQWSHNIVVRNNRDDTMLKFWSAYCELEKSLGFQCSILTREPFYKADRKTTDLKTFYEYCCRDSAVTYEINEKLEHILNDAQKEHYRFNVAVLNVLLYAELRGFRYDESLAEERLKAMRSNVWAAQRKMDAIAERLGALQGIDYEKTHEEILAQVNSICCYKRDSSQPKTKYAEKGYSQVASRLGDTTALSEDEKGQISSLCDATMNTKSTKFKDFLYDTCGLPTQYKKDPKTKEMKVTTDYLSILKLSKTHDHPALGIALELSLLRTRAQMLAVPSYRGRMHCSYNVVGSETGRVTSSKSMLYITDKKRVGTNMQTISDDWEIFDEDHPLRQGMRDLYLADDECYIAKCDLKGADGWSIGAYMAHYGDPTMLDDLKAGLKPAQIVAHVLKYGPQQTVQHAYDRTKLKEIVSTIKKEDWQYFVSKVGIWGTAYTMGPGAIANNVFIQSEGKVNLSKRDAEAFQNAIFVRYKVKKLHEATQRQINTQHYPFTLYRPNGSIRKFYGRKKEILGEVLADVPQVVTTFATLKAALRLWTDPQNRYYDEEGRCKLKVEIIHQVHDELVCQFKIENKDFFKIKIKQWFDNPIMVAGQKLTIPYDGAIGIDWSMGKDSKIEDL